MLNQTYVNDCAETNNYYNFIFLIVLIISQAQQFFQRLTVVYINNIVTLNPKYKVFCIDWGFARFLSQVLKSP